MSGRHGLPAVGTVHVYSKVPSSPSGNLTLPSTAGAGVYWKYENWIRRSEARFRSMLGVTGPIYVIRKIDLAPLPRHAVVADLVYAPLETPLLAAARARGLATADGLGMLLYQAVRGFQLWFGFRPEVTPQLRVLVETDLAK